MTYKLFIIQLTLVTAMTTVIVAEAKALKGSKPNIIVIMPDDSGYGNHSCFGNPVIKTPNIDTLQQQSLLLTQYHFSERCSPSRVKLTFSSSLPCRQSDRPVPVDLMPRSARLPLRCQLPLL